MENNVSDDSFKTMRKFNNKFKYYELKFRKAIFIPEHVKHFETSLLFN